MVEEVSLIFALLDVRMHFPRTAHLVLNRCRLESLEKSDLGLRLTLTELYEWDPQSHNAILRGGGTCVRECQVET